MQPTLLILSPMYQKPYKYLKKKKDGQQLKTSSTGSLMYKVLSRSKISSYIFIKKKGLFTLNSFSFY